MNMLFTYGPAESEAIWRIRGIPSKVPSSGMPSTSCLLKAWRRCRAAADMAEYVERNYLIKCEIQRSNQRIGEQCQTINSKDSEVKELAFPTRLMRRSRGPGLLASRDPMTACRSRVAHTSCAVSCFGCRSLLCISAFGGFV